ncbi:MAG: hypothetical protein KA206_10675, partial [Paludibacter sp.]|nr:hypothetical protein [Paludibacter sp.]
MSNNFKLSAVAVALAAMSGSALAVTTNTTDNLFSPGTTVVSTDAGGAPVSTTSAISSVGNIGFSQQSTTNSVSAATGAPNATIQKYDANSQGNPFAYTLYSVTNSTGITYYTDIANTGALTKATTAELAAISASTLNFTGDKTGQIFTSTQTGQSANTTAIVNQQQTSYSSAVNQSTTTSLTNAALTNSTGATPAATPDPTNGQVLVSVGNLVNNQSVTTGILVNASGNP